MGRQQTATVKVNEVVNLVTEALRDALESSETQVEVTLDQVQDAISENGWDLSDLGIDLQDVPVCDVIDAHGFGDVVAECISQDCGAVARAAAEDDPNTALGAVIDAGWGSEHEAMLDLFNGHLSDEGRENFRKAIGAATVDEAKLRAEVEREVRAKVEAEIRERLMGCLFPARAVVADGDDPVNVAEYRAQQDAAEANEQ